MLQMLRDLIAHKGFADAALLKAIGQHEAAAADPEVRDLLHHILLANRFWLMSMLGQPFVLEEESHPAASFDALVRRFATTHADESAWLTAATVADLERTLKNPLIPGGECSIGQALVQVCLHSHGHRAQAAKLLRRRGGTPPPNDFILWLTHRRAAEWSAGG